MRYPGFVGPSNPSRSANVDLERTINYFAEIIGAGTPKVDRTFYACPGLAPFVVLPEGPVRGLFYQDGRAFAVAGVHLYELFATQTYTVRGAVAAGNDPATLVSNGTAGHQLFVVSGGLGYIFDLNTLAFAQIVADGFPNPCVMGAFADSYFLALQGQSNQYAVSALLDGTAWDALSVAQVSESSNAVLAFIVDHREIWLFGSKTTEIWYDSGDPSFPFQPIQGTFIEQGIIAPFSAGKLDNTVIWLGGDERGAGIVWKAEGYTPKRISTHAVESVIQGLPTYRNALAWTYQQDGHGFYVLYLPNADTTWVYDVAAQSWHERARWNDQTQLFEPHFGRCHAFGFGKHLVGSRLDGCVYEMSLGFYHDALIL